MNTLSDHTFPLNRDHEVIRVDNALKRKVKIKGMGGIDTGAIDRAEKALEDLSVNFDKWLEEEVTDLTNARDQVREHGLVSPHFEEIFRVAHDIKGEGETLGYPLATIIAASLCKLLYAPEDKTVIPLSIIDSHVDAIRRVLHDKIRDDSDTTARAVADRLVEVVMEFAEHEEAKKQAASEG